MNKTLAFLHMATTGYKPSYIVKMDDDLYMRPDRLLVAVSQWRDRGAGGFCWG